MKKPVLGITMGDAAGIGAEITLKACADPKLYEKSRPVVYGDAKVLKRAAEILHSKVQIHVISSPKEAAPSVDRLEVIDLNCFAPRRMQLSRTHGNSGQSYPYQRLFHDALESQIKRHSRFNPRIA